MVYLELRAIRKLTLTSFILLFICAAKTDAQKQSLPLIPLPEKIEYIDGTFKVAEFMTVSGADGPLQEYFISKINDLTGVYLLSGSSTSSNILLNIAKWGMEKEEYRLSINGTRVIIVAAGKEGLFRGMQTFFQLIPAEIKAGKAGHSFELPYLNIEDKPRFSHRGLNLDCSRQFMSKDFIKRYIDLLAYYKFNTFHWHLTDDQGWRIEINKYGKLTKIGSVRKTAGGVSPDGEFYTQDDIKEIVYYAQSRYINIIPEIEMPGHVMASLASYPDNACTEGPFGTTEILGEFKDIYCAGDEGTYDFIENILDEVCGFFPGKYIHIGGRDVFTERWESCEVCQGRIVKDNLKDVQGLKSYFINRVSSYLASKGKEAIVWDDSTRQSISSDIIVQSALDIKSAGAAVKNGHNVICSPASYTNLEQDPEFLNLRKVYSFEPVPPELSEKEAKHILGGEANLWTGRIPQERVDQKLFPRMLALAEAFWSAPASRDYDDFHIRLQKNYGNTDEFDNNGEKAALPLATEPQLSGK